MVWTFARFHRKERYMRKLVAAVLIPALILLLAGCGGSGEMSLPEYRKSISELHDDVAWDLGVAFEQLANLDFESYYDMPELQEVFRNAQDILFQALEAAEAMQPPPQAEALHADLIGFYSSGAEEMRDLDRTMGFFQAVLPMLRDVENLALPNLPEDAGEPDIKAAAIEDRKTMEAYLKELDRMEPPQELEEYSEKLIAFFRSIDEAVAGMEQSITTQDLSAFVAFRQWFAVHIEMTQTLWDEAMSYLGGLNERVDSLIERGKELAGRIQQL
jgi:hypothetical protein